MHALSNMLSLLLLLLLGSQEGYASPTLDKRQTTGRYCNPGTQICYLEYSWGATVPVFRVAVPDSAATNTAFDTLLQIVSPASLGWVGFAWGGGMTLNPLTVVWPNGNGATVSSRWATCVFSFFFPFPRTHPLPRALQEVSETNKTEQTAAAPSPQPTPRPPTAPWRPRATPRTGRSRRCAPGAASGAAAG